MNKEKTIANYRKAFPILHRNVDGKPLVYFDNAATTQKTLGVISAIQKHYESSHANVHRASHSLSVEATIAFEKTRKQVQHFIQASSEKEIIWTKGTTESINLVAQTWGRDSLNAGDEIILSYSEHHANIVPWQMLAEQIGFTIKVATLTDEGLIDIRALKALINDKTKLIACTHISNVVGKINDLAQIVDIAKQHNIVTLFDGAQAVAHIKVNVQALDCDFYVFSAHKMYGPNGVGVLYGRQRLLEKMPPYQGGGEMIKRVSFTETSYAEIPFKFEPGTPNISGVIAFSQALTFIEKNADFSHDYEAELINYTYQKLSEIPAITPLFNGKPDIALFSFTLKSTHNYDLATYLNTQGIAIRSGHHCAMPLMSYKNVAGCIRVSLAPYNTLSEIDALVDALNTYIQVDTADLVEDKRSLKGLLNESENQGKNKAINPAQKEMEQYFSGAQSWDSRHRLIMLLGKKLTRLTAEDKSDNNLIEGCESSAWLMYTLSRGETGKDNRISFSADSDAKVIRGLLVIVFAAVNEKSPEEILTIDMPAYFEGLGLLSHLSPSRGNGLNAIVKRVMDIAASC